MTELDRGGGESLYCLPEQLVGLRVEVPVRSVQHHYRKKGIGLPGEFRQRLQQVG